MATPKSDGMSKALKNDLDALKKTRDELRVQLRLAKADARDEWKKLEKSWQLVENEMKRVGDHSKAPAKQIGSAARDLVKELKAGYRRIRSQIKDEARA